MVHLDFQMTNNMVEYEALYGLTAIHGHGNLELPVKGNSQLVIKQDRGECNCNDQELDTTFHEVSFF
jgi:ribonuclease HI